MARRLVLLVVALGTGAVWAQDAISWQTDPKAAVRTAQSSGRPLMVYVLASSKDRDDKVKNAQREALADPRVVRLAQRFVPLRLSRSGDREVLKDFGLRETANMEMSFVTPDGEKIGDLSAGGVGQADTVVQKLNAVIKVYRETIFKKRVKPVLDDPKAKPADLKQAVRLVGEFGIATGEADVLALLDRERLQMAVRTAIYETLADLSTKTGVEKLLELTRGDDAQAAKALEKCNPVGAETLVADLSAESFDYAVYKTAAQICGIRDMKAAKFFDNAQPRLIEAEVERVRKLVQDAARRWKETHDDTSGPAQ